MRLIFVLRLKLCQYRVDASTSIGCTWWSVDNPTRVRSITAQHRCLVSSPLALVHLDVFRAVLTNYQLTRVYHCQCRWSRPAVHSVNITVTLATLVYKDASFRRLWSPCDARDFDLMTNKCPDMRDEQTWDLDDNSCNSSSDRWSQGETLLVLAYPHCQWPSIAQV